jgi:hypothetical protein
MIIIMTILSSYGCTLLCEAMANIPGNEEFEVHFFPVFTLYPPFSFSPRPFFFFFFFLELIFVSGSC